MKIVSTTLANNSEHLIRDALLSVVDWVDICLVINTGVTDRTLEIAKEVAGDKYVEASFTIEGDFAKARNFALTAATELGGDWAVTLDTDERIIGGPDLRTEMLSSTEDLLYVTYVSGHYSKERCFKLPAKDHWMGPVHEAFVLSGKGRTVEGVQFDEMAKTPEEYERKFRRDVEVLSAYVKAHPTDPRWHYYLGESYRNLGNFELATSSYDACSALRGWDEEAAWACFRAGECLCAMERYGEALDRLHTGLSIHAGIAELAWFAGFVSYKMGRDQQAVYWSRLAIVHGLFRGDGATVPRIAFRDPVGLWEGPYDVLRWAEKRRGNEEAAAEAEALWLEAKQARESSLR